MSGYEFLSLHSLCNIDYHCDIIDAPCIWNMSLPYYHVSLSIYIVECRMLMVFLVYISKQLKQLHAGLLATRLHHLH